MLMKMYQLAFFFTLITGTIVACSANSWFTCWLGLEINLMSLIPLLVLKLTPLSTETAIKYFLAQAMASLLLIFSSLLDSSTSYMNLMGVHNEIILIALSIKAGMAPFHFWFPQVMKIAGWAQCAMILTWQKIAPFVLLASSSNTIIAQAVILCSALVGALGGLNQLNMKNILTYSSIVHSAWMLALCSAASISAWGSYFMIYSTVSLSIVMVLYKTNTQMMPQILSFKWNNTTKTFFMVSLMSLGGLPPFLGFLAKLGAIQLIMLTTNAITTSALITASLVSLFYYTRVIYTMLMKTSKNKMINNNHSSTTPHTLITLTIAGNIMAPALVIMT